MSAIAMGERRRQVQQEALRSFLPNPLFLLASRLAKLLHQSGLTMCGSIGLLFDTATIQISGALALSDRSSIVAMRSPETPELLLAHPMHSEKKMPQPSASTKGECSNQDYNHERGKGRFLTHTQATPAP